MRRYKIIVVVNISARCFSAMKSVVIIRSKTFFLSIRKIYISYYEQAEK